MLVDDRALQKSLRREKKKNKRKSHRVDGRSVFLIQEEQRKRADEIRKRRNRKARINQKESLIES